MIFAAGLVALGLLAAMYVTRALQIRHLQHQIGTLMAQERSVLDQQTALHARLAQKNDPAAIEEVARQKLGLVMPGEQKVIFVQEGD